VLDFSRDFLFQNPNFSFCLEKAASLFEPKKTNSEIAGEKVTKAGEAVSGAASDAGDKIAEVSKDAKDSTKKAGKKPSESKLNPHINKK
jgi:hypothetical protein